MPRPAKGSNSGDTILDGEAQAKLKTIFDQIESLTDNELHEVKESIKALYADAKALGFNPKPIRKLVALRGKEKGKVLEEKALVELYAHALGVEDLV